MLKRTLTAIVGFAILIPMLYFSDTYVYVAGVVVLSVLAIFEMLRCIGFHKEYKLSVPLYIIAAAAPVMARIIGKISIFLVFAMSIMFIYMFYLLTIVVFSKGKFVMKDAGIISMMGIYIVGGFSTLILIRDVEKIGIYLLILVFVAAWSTDIFAYLIGRFFGKHKLIPEISPKKTVEGMIGGVVFETIAFVLYGFIIGRIFEVTPHYLFLAIAGVALSFISQLGDLIASALKREFGIKDYGKLLPGHGGVLDRFDSIIAIAPFLLMLSASTEFFTLFI